MTSLTDDKKGPENNKLADNILPITAVVVLILALVFAKGAVFALRPLLKFAIPGGIAYFAWRWVKKTFMAVAGKTIKQKLEDAVRGSMGGPMGGGPPPGSQQSARQAPADTGPVIDLCPKCGTYLKPGHRCAPKA